MSRLAKYIEIMNYFIEKIESGAIKDGEQLPMEENIRELFSASHMTISKAMNELVLKGYARRVPGKGTFATHNYKNLIKKNIIFSRSITQQIFEAGMEPRTELYKYSIEKGKNAPDIAKILNIDDESYLHYFVRLRYGNDNLVCISYTYISQAILPTIDITQLEGSFNQYIQTLGIHRSYGSNEFCAVLPTPKQAKILGSAHIPLLKQSILWHVDNLPFEYTNHYFIGDKYKITSDLRLIYNQDGTSNKEFINPDIITH